MINVTSDNGNPVLSIAIPTYNRRDYLIENLSHLLPQLANYGKEVELLVSDNCSDVNPQDALLELGSKYGVEIRFYRQISNIGPKANNLFLFSKVKGDYVFLMGDDDILAPNFCDVIVPFLRLRKYGIVHFGRLNGDAKCSNTTIHDSVFIKPIEEYAIGDFIKRVLSSPNFMSSIIVKKECIDLGNKYDVEEYKGYKWLGNFLFGAIELGFPCLYYYFPLVIMRNPVRSWDTLWPYLAIVGMSNLFRDIDKSIPGVYDKWMERLHDERYYEMELMLSSVSNDREFYKTKKSEFYPHLTRSEQRFYNYWLWTPLPGLSKKIYFSIIRRLKRKL